MVLEGSSNLCTGPRKYPWSTASITVRPSGLIIRLKRFLSPQSISYLSFLVGRPHNCTIFASFFKWFRNISFVITRPPVLFCKVLEDLEFSFFEPDIDRKSGGV